ncbi:MAG: hypothetical protein PHV33_08800 [Elusimicrobiales bacterium]|nr:hypothetical protein [Elusimicrobiales bacterium]
MKKTIVSVCLFSLTAGASAFELPAVGAAALRGAPVPAQLAAPAPVPQPAGETPGWQELREGFFAAEKPADLYALLGVYKGHLHPLYEREDYTVPFVMAVYRDALTGAVKAAFPMPPNGQPETVMLKLTQSGAEFADAWGGRARVVIRRDGKKLRLFTNLYSDETYGVCEPAGALPMPGGDEIRARGLEDDMPHGSIPDDSEADPAAILSEFGVTGVTLDMPAAEIARQEKHGALPFDRALRAALGSFLNDYSDPESPLCVVLSNLDASCDKPAKGELAAAKKKLLSLMNLRASTLRLVREGGEHQPEQGETVRANWVFNLYLDYSDHGFWAIVDRAGRKPAYNYGFN